MPTFEPFAVVKVPFPYTDRPITQRRPALVIASSEPTEGHSILWVLMITSAEHRRWAHDVEVTNHRLAGLPAPSVVRCAKIATIDATSALELGVLPVADREGVRTALRAIGRAVFNSTSG